MLVWFPQAFRGDPFKKNKFYLRIYSGRQTYCFDIKLYLGGICHAHVSKYCLESIFLWFVCVVSSAHQSSAGKFSLLFEAMFETESGQQFVVSIYRRSRLGGRMLQGCEPSVVSAAGVLLVLPHKLSLPVQLVIFTIKWPHIEEYVTIWGCTAKAN